MIGRAMQIPTDEVLIEALGAKISSGPEPWVRVVDFESSDGYIVKATLDVVGKSVHLIVFKDGSELVRIEREGAVVVSASLTALTATFRTEDTLGRLDLTLHPRFGIADHVLRG